MPAQKRFKVGVTIHPQQCTIRELRDAWLRADELGVDSIWFWDHDTKNLARILKESHS
ncbi:MAG TPA: hypothetical protein VIO34_10655 [Candidatus Dormibacteraeota bacterium]|jgi:alkanesulfonate monooxygenase SsuD/methylene tetrahydromethanopterin reductase-like flavin-dependent oxidoreductase (luciferase family)